MKMDTRSSYPLAQPAPGAGYGGVIPSGRNLPVNRMHISYSVSGNQAITQLTSLARGTVIWLSFDGAASLVNSAKLLCPGRTNIQCAAGDAVVVRSKGNGVWRVLDYFPAASQRVLAPIFSFEGDSLSNPNNLGTWPTLLAQKSAFFAGTQHQFAADGDTASAMVSQYTSQAGALSIAAGQEAYYFLWSGRNDIAAGTSAATIYGYLTTMWAAARASGYKVVAFAMKADGAFNSTQNGVMAALNLLILSDQTLYDYVVRLDALLRDSSDTAIFNPDTTHLTSAGNALVVQEVISTLLNVAPVYASPTDVLGGGLQLNGSLEVSQENGATAKTGLSSGQFYIVDGVKVAVSAAPVLTAQQVADAPPGFTNSLKITVTTAAASLSADDNAFVSIPIEGYRSERLAFGTNAAQPVSIGFWTKVHRVGTYSGSILNGASDRSYPFTFTQNVADKWEFKTITVPGDIAGTWLTTNGLGLQLVIALACGATYAGPANAWAGSLYVAATGTTNGVASTSDVFQIAGVIVLPGIHLPSSQKLPQVMRPFDQELLLCKRHLQLITGYSLSGQALSATQILVTGQIQAPLRAAPTIGLLKTSYTSAAFDALVGVELL
ncbi:hypothetical protein ACVWZ6_005600 [Bradyrhizobium sp. GM6.1]